MMEACMIKLSYCALNPKRQHLHTFEPIFWCFERPCNVCKTFWLLNPYERWSTFPWSFIFSIYLSTFSAFFSSVKIDDTEFLSALLSTSRDGKVFSRRLWSCTINPSLRSHIFMNVIMNSKNSLFWRTTFLSTSVVSVLHPTMYVHFSWGWRFKLYRIHRAENCLIDCLEVVL